jgi:hypothetical protein
MIPDNYQWRIRLAIRNDVVDRIWDQAGITAREQVGEGFFWDELREAAEGAWSQAQEDNYDAG